MLYAHIKVDIASKFHDKIKKAIKKGEGKSAVSVKIHLTNPEVGHETLLLTKGQILKMERA